MRKSLTVLGASASIALAGFGLASPAMAAPANTQQPPVANSSPSPTQQEEHHEPDRTGLWGLTGLLGLAGLAGLARGRRREEPVRAHTTPVTHETHRTDYVARDAAPRAEHAAGQRAADARGAAPTTNFGGR